MRMSRKVSGVFLLIMCCVVFGSILVSAHGSANEEPVDYKYYKSIEIESGDTLWSIAEEYMTDDFESVAEYVNLLKKMNNLNNDKIISGQNLIVVYNDTMYIE